MRRPPPRGVSQPTEVDRPLQTPSASRFAATLITPPGTPTVPPPAPQQKTAVGQTAPPLPVAAPMSTMSAPPVIADPRPSAPALSGQKSTASSMAPVLVAAAVIVVGLLAGVWYVFGRSTAKSVDAP